MRKVVFCHAKASGLTKLVYEDGTVEIISPEGKLIIKKKKK